MTALDITCVLLDKLGFLRNTIVPNVRDGVFFPTWPYVLHECDVLCVTKTGYGIEYEIKVSIADIKKDQAKTHQHQHHYLRQTYFVIPGKLYEKAEKMIPPAFGIYTVDHYPEIGKFTLTKKRKAPVNKNALKWTDSLRAQLYRLGTLRLPGLYKKIQKLTAK